MGDPKNVLDPMRIFNGGNLENNIKNTFSTVGENLKGVGKNLETNVGRHFRDVGAVLKGNFNNIGQNALRDMSPSFNENDQKAFTKSLLGSSETTSERMVSEAEAKVAEAESLDRATIANETVRANAGVVAGLVDARKRAPGRAQTLLNNPGKGSNTLLTMIGKK